MRQRSRDPGTDGALELERGGSDVGRSTLTQRYIDKSTSDHHRLLDAVWAPIQRDANEPQTALDDDSIRTAAGRGIAGSGERLPYLDQIQRAFGSHDVTGVRAHFGDHAREANAALGSHAYATGNDVAFAAANPSLELVAHEAAHVVQQRAGVHLSSAVGQVGDRYEQHADAVAARVVRGESAADLLDAGPASTSQAIQRKERGGDGAAAPKDKVAYEHKREKGPLGLSVKVGTDGIAGEISDKIELPLSPIPIFTGVFIEPSLSLTGKGSVAVAPDGAFQGTLSAEVEGKVTINGGIPKVASIYGGVSLALNVTGLGVSRSPDGDWSVQFPEAALVGKLVIGAKVEGAKDEKEGAPAGWVSGAQLEWNPGGEFELLKLSYLDDFRVREGKDVARLVEALNDLCAWAGVMNPFSDDAVVRRVERGEHLAATMEDRIGMIRTLLAGACLKDDERAIIKILDASSEKGDLDTVIAQVGRRNLLDKINDDVDAKAKLKRYLTKPKDALGERPGRFSVLYSAPTLLGRIYPISNAKLQDGSVWVRSDEYVKALQDAPKKFPMFTMMGPQNPIPGMLASIEQNDGWIERQKGSKAVALESNSDLAYTLYFDSEAVARSEAAGPSTGAGVLPFTGRLNSF